MRDFLRLPFAVYRNDPNRVAPITSEVRRLLDEKGNPYFANASLELFTCYKNGTAAARTAIIINRLHEEKFGVKTAFFGFFESIDDETAVQPLFGAVEGHCLSKNIEVLEGPFNPNHYNELGLLASGFNSRPAFFQAYNPKYYSRLLENIGFSVSARFHTRKNDDIRSYVRECFGRVSRPKPSDGYNLRSFRMNELDAELENIREVFNDAFSNNWNFLPLSKEEYLFSAKFFKLVTRPDLVKIVEYNGEPVGVLQCVLDINPLLRFMKGKVGPVKYLRFLHQRRNIRNLIIYAVGVKKAHQNTKAFELIFQALCEIASRYEILETTWLLGENIPAVKAAERLGLVPDRQFVIYEKRLAR